MVNLKNIFILFCIIFFSIPHGIAKCEKRIISLTPALTEFAFYFNQNLKSTCIVGISTFSDYPKATKKIKKVGAYPSPNLEKIVKLHPTLVLIAKDGNPKNIAEDLKRINIPFFIFKDRNLEEFISSILNLGEILNNKEKALNLTRDINKSLNHQLKSRKIYYQLSEGSLTTISGETLIGDLFKKLGLKNIFEESKIQYPTPSIEEIIRKDPEIILFSSFSKKLKDIKINIEFWSPYKKISAVKNKKIIAIDSNLLNRPGPRILNAIHELESNL